MENCINEQLRIAQKTSITLKDLATVYMNNLDTAKIQTTQTRVSWFVTYYGDLLAHEITAEDCEDMFVYLETNAPSGREVSGATINRYRSTLQGLLTYGRKRRLFPRGWVNPVTDTEKRPESYGRERFLSKDEYENLIAAARLASWPKLPLIIMLAMTTGARRGNLENLRWEDVNFEERKIYIGKTKNGSPHICVLTESVVTELKKFYRGKKEGLIFASTRAPNTPFHFNKAYKKALQDAGIGGEGVVFHSLRHSHASHLASSGASLLEIANSLNHRTMSMVARYAHLDTTSRAKMIDRVFG